MDPVNPTCPLNPDWSNNPTMKLTVEKRAGMKVMLAEGRVDPGLPDRLSAALKANPDVTEICLRSPGGDRSEEHTSVLQSLILFSFAVFCFKYNNSSFFFF